MTIDAWDNQENSNGEKKSEEMPDDAPKEMTLDEWKRMEEEKRVVPQYNIRKPGEGENNDLWKGTYVLKKKEEDEEIVEYIEYVVCMILVFGQFIDMMDIVGQRTKQEQFSRMTRTILLISSYSMTESFLVGFLMSIWHLYTPPH